MGIEDKLSLLVDLNEKEKNIAKEKFLATLALVTYDELKEVVDYLASKGIIITKARYLKVLGIPKNEIIRKISILEELHETNIYVQDPSKLSSNVIDINKKIKYCIQNGISYKKEDGTYESFIFSEKAWQERTQKIPNAEAKEVSSVLDETLVSIAPVIEETNSLDLKSMIEEPLNKESEIIPFSPILEDDSNVIDIKEFQMTEENPIMTFDALQNDVAKMQEELGTIENQKTTLEEEKARLKAYQDSLAKEFVGFDDFDFENSDSFGMGRVA